MIKKKEEKGGEITDSIVPLDKSEIFYAYQKEAKKLTRLPYYKLEELKKIEDKKLKHPHKIKNIKELKDHHHNHMSQHLGKTVKKKNNLKKIKEENFSKAEGSESKFDSKNINSIDIKTQNNSQQVGAFPYQNDDNKIFDKKQSYPLNPKVGNDLKLLKYSVNEIQSKNLRLSKKQRKLQEAENTLASFMSKEDKSYLNSEDSYSNKIFKKSSSINNMNFSASANLSSNSNNNFNSSSNLYDKDKEMASTSANIIHIKGNDNLKSKDIEFLGKKKKRINKYKKAVYKYRFKKKQFIFNSLFNLEENSNNKSEAVDTKEVVEPVKQNINNGANNDQFKNSEISISGACSKNIINDTNKMSIEKNQADSLENPNIVSIKETTNNKINLNLNSCNEIKEKVQIQGNDLIKDKISLNSSNIISTSMQMNTQPYNSMYNYYNNWGYLPANYSQPQLYTYNHANIYYPNSLNPQNNSYNYFQSMPYMTNWTSYNNPKQNHQITTPKVGQNFKNFNNSKHKGHKEYICNKFKKNDDKKKPTNNFYNTYTSQDRPNSDLNFNKNENSDKKFMFESLKNSNSSTVITDDFKKYLISEYKIDKDVTKLEGSDFNNYINQSVDLKKININNLQKIADPNVVNQYVKNFEGLHPDSNINKKQIREYVDQVLDPEIDKKFGDFITKLRDLYFKKKQTNPLKAKRRFVVGMREIEKFIRLGEVKCLFIVPNIEKVEGENSLDDRLSKILTDCDKKSIPIFFGLNKFKLGKISRKKHSSVSILAIINVEGFERDLKDLIDLGEKFRKLFYEKYYDTKSQFEGNRFINLEKFELYKSKI